MEAERLPFVWKAFRLIRFPLSRCLPDNGFLFYIYRMPTIFLGFPFSSRPIFRILPAVLMMLAIFLFSARLGDMIPMSLWKQVLYKAGHVVGYAMLALSYWRAFRFDSKQRWIAWLLAVLYAITDEYHQSFVPFRHSTAFDVLVYDNLGALISLGLAGMFAKQKQPASEKLAGKC
jgi:VanZ family protein